jgi:hypothetical protein
MYKYVTTRSTPLTQFEGVSVILYKMTEKRRLSLRGLLADSNHKIKAILREQEGLEKEPEETRDMSRWVDLQEEFDEIMLSQVNPAWITWGVKQIEGLEVDGRTLGVSDWSDWPSALFTEVLQLVKSEAELNGSERKNFESPTTSGELVGLIPRSSTVPSAVSEAGGETETVTCISKAE